MGYNSRDEDWQADRARDDRKHDFDPLPGDVEEPMELHLAPPTNPGLALAVIVKGMKDPRAAGALIDQHVATAIAGAKLDAPMAFERIVAESPQRCAAAKLVGYCEGLAGSATLPLETETQLRRLIAETLSAFGMSAAERHERETV